MSERRRSFAEVFPHFLAERQYQIVRALLDEIYGWRNEQSGHFSEADFDANRPQEPGPSSPYGDARVEARIEAAEELMYREVAVCHSAVGLVSPFVEGFLYLATAYIKYLADSSADAPEVAKERRGLLTRPDKVRDSLELGNWLTEDRCRDLQLLGEYRNRTLHHGFAWPDAQIEEFLTEVTGFHRADSLRKARYGGKCWMISISDAFMSSVVTDIDAMMREFGKVCSARGGHFAYGWPWDAGSTE